MLQVAQLSHSFWAEAVSTACYLQNCSFTSALSNTTPFELWTGMKPDIRNLRIFGCPAYSHIPEEKRTKLDTKTLKCIFIGYSETTGTKGYRLFDPTTKRVFTSRDVIFYEDSLLTGGALPLQRSPSSTHFDPDELYQIPEISPPPSFPPAPNIQSEPSDPADTHSGSPTASSTLHSALGSPGSPRSSSKSQPTPPYRPPFVTCLGTRLAPR